MNQKYTVYPLERNITACLSMLDEELMFTLTYRTAYISIYTWNYYDG